MSAQDDELVRRYRDASEHDEARPGAQVRGAVRAHAQMVATAANAQAAPSNVVEKRHSAANASRWKISALGSVVVIGLTALLLLQFERGTPEEKEIIFGKGRAEVSVPKETASEVPLVAGVASDGAANPTIAPTEAATDRMRKMPAPLPPAAAKPAGKVVKPVGNAPPPGAQAELAPADEQKESISGFPASATASDASGVLRDLPLPPQPSLEARQQAPAKAAPSPAANVSPSAARAESAVPTPPAPRSLSSRSPTLGRQTMADLNADFWQAAKDGRSQQLEQLVGQGVPVNVRDSAGRTALMLAAINGQTSAVQKLLALSADPRLLDSDGMTAAQQARRFGHVGVAQLIEARS